MKLIHLLYIIIVVILAVLLYSYLKEVGGKWFSIIEGARTYPMPRRHPLDFQYGTSNNDSQGNAESLNSVIDNFISQHFDQNGVPYLNTIDAVQSYVVGPGMSGPYNYGTVTNNMKSQLTDIGYYFIEMVLPLLPTMKNPKPSKKALPPLKLSSMPGFPLHVSRSQKCLVYRGNPENNLQFIQNSAAISAFDSRFNAAFNRYFVPGSGTDSSASPSPSASDSNTNDNVDCTSGSCASDCCGITCPKTCFDNALGLSNTSTSDTGSSTSSSSGSQTQQRAYHSSISSAQIYNSMRTSVQYANNELTICPSSQTGYDITQIALTPGTYENTTLEAKIANDVSEYFVEKDNDPLQLVPTEKLLSIINAYATNFTPMDAYHYELLQELIYYVLQVIIPGLPTMNTTEQTNTTPQFYVEWRPFLKYQ
jgi:hypothetical protein